MEAWSGPMVIGGAQAIKVFLPDWGSIARIESTLFSDHGKKSATINPKKGVAPENSWFGVTSTTGWLLLRYTVFRKSKRA